MENNFNIIIKYVLLIALIETIAMSSLKKGSYQSSNANNYPYIVIGMLCYTTIAYILYITFKLGGIGYVNLLWNCITLITGIIIGSLLFKERINHFTCLSFITALLAIYFAYLSNETE